MAHPTDSIALAEWISSVFNDGIILTDDLVRFLEATFGSQDIVEILAGDHDSEMDSFLELLCYPDFNTQLQYETLWGDRRFGSDDLAVIVTHLVPQQATITTPSGDWLGAIEVPAFALEAFVCRLNITWRLPAPITWLQQDFRSRTPALKARVHLRNTPLQWHPAQINLINRFFEKMPIDSSAYETSLVFLLAILSELTPQQDGFEFLVGKKFFYFQSLCRAETFDRKRLASNMEIIMLQGARAAHGSIEQWRNHMRQIDLICQNLFGRTQFFQQPSEYCLDTTGKDNIQKIQDMINLLA